MDFLYDQSYHELLSKKFLKEWKRNRRLKIASVDSEKISLAVNNNN
jgi:hypothetical protein